MALMFNEHFADGYVLRSFIVASFAGAFYLALTTNFKSYEATSIGLNVKFTSIYELAGIVPYLNERLKMFGKCCYGVKDCFRD